MVERSATCRLDGAIWAECTKYTIPTPSSQASIQAKPFSSIPLHRRLIDPDSLQVTISCRRRFPARGWCAYGAESSPPILGRREETDDVRSNVWQKIAGDHSNDRLRFFAKHLNGRRPFLLCAPKLEARILLRRRTSLWLGIFACTKSSPAMNRGR